VKQGQRCQGWHHSFQLENTAADSGPRPSDDAANLRPEYILLLLLLLLLFKK